MVPGRQKVQTDRQTEGRTEWTDGRTHGRRQNYFPPTSSGDKKISQQGANASFSSARKAALSTQVQNAIHDNLSKECKVKCTGKTRPSVSKDSDIRLIIAV